MVLKILFHLIGAIHFCYGCYYDFMYVNIPSSSGTVAPYGGKLKYLTYLDAMVQTVYFTVAFLNDLFGTNEQNPPEKPLIRRVRDVMFSALAFPLAMFVGTTFWGIYAIDRELILPRSLDPYFPLWLNHLMHTNIMIFILIDLVTSFRMYPKKNVGLSILTTFMLAYLIWLHVVYYKSGVWVYPILAVLNWPLRVVFYLFSLGITFGLYSGGETLNRTIWSQQIADNLRSEKKKEK